MNNAVELIQVTGISPFSVYSGNVRYSFNKGVDSTMFQKGHTYSVSINIGTNGGKYINRVDGDLGVVNLTGTPEASLNADENKLPTAPNPTTATASTPAKAPYKKPWSGGGSKKSDDSGLTKEEWAAKDRRIQRSGLIQAAVVAVASHVGTVEQLEVEAIKLSEAMLTWVNTATSSLPSQKSPELASTVKV